MPAKEKVRRTGTKAVRQSLEVRHARRGAGLMLRRGLHGVKNWALEPEADGTPRGPGGKTLRMLVALVPFWIVLSTVTGGPERGGQQMGVGRAIVMALVVTLAELAWFSARERKAGREEPWLKLPDLGTESDESEPKTLVQPTSEAPTAVLEKSQVSGPEPSEVERNTGDEVLEKEENGRIEAETVPEMEHQAISEEPKIEATEGRKGLFGPLRNALQKATTDGANTEEPDPLSSDSAEGVAQPSWGPPHEATPETAYSLVKTPATPLQEEVEEAAFGEAIPIETDSTESDENGPRNAPDATEAEVLQAAVHETPSATEEPQVEGLKGALQQPLPLVLETEVAASGPYLVTSEPVAEDWWLVKPDGPTEEEPEAVEDAPVIEPEIPGPEAPAEAPEGTVEVGGVRLPPQAVRYLAVQAMSSASDQDKETARLEVVRWARGEVNAQRVSQAEIARMLGVNRSTVSRWLDADPWATPTEE